MADNNRVIVELGTVIKNRGEWDSLAQNAKLYKDNVVQYNGSAYIVKSAPASGIGKDILPTNTAYYEVFAGVGELATGSDFTNPDATKRAKVPTVGAILDGLNDGVYDVSKRNPTAGPNSDGKFTLEYILNNANTLIPTSWRHGGMIICFVDSSDHKYIQARCMAQNFTTDVTQWQGVDTKPVKRSKNLVEGGGIYNLLYADKVYSNNYLDSTGAFTTNNNWLIVEYTLNNPIAENDVIVWYGADNFVKAKLGFYDSTGNLKVAYSATGISREITILNNDDAIGSVKILASYKKENASTAYLSLNGVKLSCNAALISHNLLQGNLLWRFCGINLSGENSSVTGSISLIDYIDVNGLSSLLFEGVLEEAIKVSSLIGIITLNVHCYDASYNSIGRLGFKDITNKVVSFDFLSNTKYIRIAVSPKTASGDNIDISSFASNLIKNVDNIIISDYYPTINRNAKASMLSLIKTRTLEDEVSIINGVYNYELGTISTSGGDQSSSWAIRSKEYMNIGLRDSVYVEAVLSEIQKIDANIGSVLYNVHCYGATKNSLGRCMVSFQNVTDKVYKFNLLAGTKYVRVCISPKTSNGDNIDISSYVNNLIAKVPYIIIYDVAPSLPQNVTTMMKHQEAIEQLGVLSLKDTSKVYTGEKISIAGKYDLIDNGSYPTGFTYAQGFAFYGNYCIQGTLGETEDGTQAALINMQTRSVINTLNLSHAGYSDLHCNVMCFGKDIITDGIMPLLYASQWNGQKCCFVYDIQLDSAVLKQVISPANLTKDGIKFGLGNVDWVVDTDNNYLFAISYVDDGFESSQIVTKFNLPLLSDGALIELEDSDIISYNTFTNYITRQDCCCNNGKLFISCGAGSQYIPYLSLHVVDVNTLKEVSLVDLQYLGEEIEGLDVYNGNLMLHTAGSNKLMKFIF